MKGTQGKLSVPPHLRRLIPSASWGEFVVWWEGLADEARSELVMLFDARRERVDRTGCQFLPLPIELSGRMAQTAEELAADEADDVMALGQLYDFVIGHEDIAFFLEQRKFQICRQHLQAKEILRRRVIPAGFRCSLRGEHCPMVRISREAGEHVRLRLARAADRPVE